MQDRLALFAANAQGIKNDFVWQDDMTKRHAAFLYAQANRTIDCEALRQCHAMIKQNTGVFSIFRDNMVVCLAALLSLSQEPQELLDDTLKVYDMLKEAKFSVSDYLVIAAYQIAAQARPTKHQDVVSRMRAFYDGMKAHHFFITGEDDYTFAAMLGLSDLGVMAGTERIEQLYNQLKGEFLDKNSVQALAHVLVLGGSNSNTVDRVLSLRDALKAKKIRLDKSTAMPILGILAMLPAETDEIVSGIGEAQKYLREQSGFGSLSVTTEEILLFAAAAQADVYKESAGGDVLDAAISTSITNIIIAQQVALMIMMIAAVNIVVMSSSASS